MSDNIRTDKIELLATKEDFIELMDDSAKLLRRIEKLEGALREIAHPAGGENHYHAISKAKAALEVIT